ncbi:hypothetical protein Hanom_Chr16g01438331 [Helianthus anomalus]
MTIDLNGSSRWAWFSHKIFKSFCLSIVFKCSLYACSRSTFRVIIVSFLCSAFLNWVIFSSSILKIDSATASFPLLDESPPRLRRGLVGVSSSTGSSRG